MAGSGASPRDPAAPRKPEGFAADAAAVERERSAMAAGAAAAQQERAAAAALARTGETVTVACKVPTGLFLELRIMEEVSEPVMGGGWKTVKRSRVVGTRYSVNGSAYRIDKAPAHAIIAGYGLTPNIPADFFEEWLSQNADLDAVRNGLIFALPNPESAAAAARERVGLISGLEPVNPSKLPRGIATATDRPI